MDGVADSFSTVALQSDQFDGNKLLKDVDFTGITSEPTTGRVQFSVSATVDPSVFSYTSTLRLIFRITSHNRADASRQPLQLQQSSNNNLCASLSQSS